jgi:hypothetical protein
MQLNYDIKLLYNMEHHIWAAVLQVQVITPSSTTAWGTPCCMGHAHHWANPASQHSIAPHSPYGVANADMARADLGQPAGS